MAQNDKILSKNFSHLQRITAMFADSNGIMRGKILPRESLEKLMSEGILLPASVFGTDATGESVAETGLVWDSGDADFPFQMVADSLHDMGGGAGVGANKNEGACLIQMFDTDGNPHPLDPRSILGGAVARLEAMELYPVIAPELEFYLINRRLDVHGFGQYAPIPNADKPPSTNQIYGIEAFDEFGAILDEMRQAYTRANIRADTAISEYGRGQYEINILHNNNALRAADEAALLRYHTRRVARRCGVDATFMGKPFADDTGSGFHLHVSLWDDKGNNLMAEKMGDDPTANPILRYAIGGLATYLKDSFAVFAPNANAWRRILPGHYAPVDKSWGVNNRTVNFRIPASDAKARRIEHRTASADCNPYLTTTLILGAMAEGIENRLEPPAMTTGNAYESPNRASLPQTWAEANRIFAESTFIKKWLGAEYAHVFIATKEYERTHFATHITPLEWQWYR